MSNNGIVVLVVVSSEQLLNIERIFVTLDVSNNATSLNEIQPANASFKLVTLLVLAPNISLTLVDLYKSLVKSEPLL